MGVAAKEHKETEFTSAPNGCISLKPNALTDSIHTSVPKKERTNFLLTLVIAAAAAYVDATGFLLSSGVYLSFMSGNTTRAAVLVGRADWQQVTPAIGVIATFVLGTAIGTVIMGISKRQGQAMVLFTAGIALAFVAALEVYWQSLRPNDVPPGWLFVLTATMGLLNPAIQRVDRVSVALTYVTGTLAKLGTAIGSKIINHGKSAAGDQSETILILVSVWFAFFIGAISGGLAAARYGLRCIIAPAIVLFVLGLLCWLNRGRENVGNLSYESWSHRCWPCWWRRCIKYGVERFVSRVNPH
jgi:uncharacterized membrane protein YoaK (UPF0700 family)